MQQGPALAKITHDQVAVVLRESADPKALLKTVVSRITLDPDSMACQIHYQLPSELRACISRFPFAAGPVQSVKCKERQRRLDA